MKSMFLKYHSILIQEDALLEQIKDLELKLYKRGQTDQTICLNKLKDFDFFK